MTKSGDTLKAPSKATAERWRERIDRVLAALQKRLDAKEPLDMAALAEIACLSPYHFHRVFRAMMGETPTETIRRLRLNRASADLLNSEASIATIAERAGYGSVESFTRAFTEAFGAPPARFRAERGRVGAPQNQQPGKKKSMPQDDHHHNVEIRDLPPLAMIALPHKGRYDQIGTTFERFSVWAGGSGFFLFGSEMAAVYFDDPNATREEDLRSAAGLIVPPDTEAPAGAPLPLEKIELIGGPHAIYMHRGPYAGLKDSYDWLYGQWLPHSDHHPADAPSYEICRNNPQTTPPQDLLTEIRLPLATPRQ